jgi:hypothetical protein
VPRQFGHLAYRYLLSKNEEPSTIPKYQPSDIEFIEMVHFALKLRRDILAHPNHAGFVVTEDQMIKCVPARLFMFSLLMFGEQSLLEESEEEAEDVSMGKKK